MTEHRERQGSPERFGFEWAHYSEILPESRGQLERWLGTTTLESFAGLRVLDVGCGMGRNPYWMLKAGAAHVTAVDIDERSLSAARANLAGFPNTNVDTCSAYDLSPEKLGRFDRVTCIGVLHHLADPPAALHRLWACVAEGGELHLWCYAREGNEYILPIIHAFRAVGARAPLGFTHAMARAVTAALMPSLVLLRWRTPYYNTLRELSVVNIESVVFDQMLPRVAHYWSRADMEALLAPLDGEVFLELAQGNSWHVRVRRRAAAAAGRAGSRDPTRNG